MLTILLMISQLQPPEFRPGQKLPKSPDDVAYEAAQHLRKAIEAEKKGPKNGVGPLHSYSLRYISLHTLPQKSVRAKLGRKAGSTETETYSPLDDTLQVLLFAVNQTNRRNPPATLIKVSPDLFAIYLDSPGWTAEAWDSVAAKDPYFRGEWIEQSTWAYLTGYTYTQYPIVRADSFISNSTIAGDYYLLLGLPKTAGEFFKQLGIDEKLLEESRRIKGAVKTDSLTVTLNNRILERRQGAFDVWSSNDVINSKGKKNALRQLGVLSGDIHKLDIDGQEHVFELGNGLWGGYLNDAKGNRVDEVPVTIANDDNYRDHRVIVGRSCITCHELGVKDFQSDQAKLLDNQVVTLRTIDPDDANKLRARYDERANQRNIKADQEAFRSAVEDIVGTSPERIAAMYSNVWRGYVEQRVTFHQAALEAGLSDDGLVSVLTPAIDPNLLYLIQAPGRTLNRDVWEDVFDDVMLLRGRPTPPKDRQALPVPSDINRPTASPKPESIAPTITVKTPGQAGEQQTATVTLKTAKPAKVISYDANDQVVMNAQRVTPTGLEMDFTLTSGATGYPRSIGVILDTGPITIPVESKP